VTRDKTSGYVDGVEPCLLPAETPGEVPASVRATPPAPELDFSAILASVCEALYVWRIDTDSLIWSENATEVLNIDQPAAVASGRRFAELADPQNPQSRFNAVMKSSERDLGPGVPYQVQYALRPPGRELTLWIEDAGRWFAGPDGKPARAHGVIRVINDRHEHEEKLEHLARVDPLTGELNRAQLTELLGSILEETIKLRSSCGFLLAAIDNLGRVNDAYGFEVADEVIAAVAKRMRAQLRGKDHLGRLAGNKFGIILNNCTIDDMLIAADRLLLSVRDDVIKTSAGPVAVTVTIGGITAPRHAHTVQQVLARAQDALSSARMKRRGSFQAYQPNLAREAQRQESMRATDEIITALNDRRIFLVYEPIVATTSRMPAFYECLMRVKRADGSLLAVSELVPLAERLGLVRLLDHRVLELALDQLIAAPDFRASINVSAASTTDPDWWAALGAMLRAHPGAAKRLMIEITETTAIHDIDETKNFVARVKDLGCRIAIDDFGAGYTSFRNLRKLGVDLVKIDGAFVRSLKTSEDDRAFVHTLIDLARRLGLETVAEWVQDDDAAAMLADWGCDYLQGELIGLASAERPWMHAPPAAAKSVASS
jgi:diguanylate cyclase (GGDEF)-like protein